MRTFNGLQIFTEQLTNSGQLDQRYVRITGNVSEVNLNAGIRISKGFVPTGVYSPGYSGQLAWDSKFLYICANGDGINGEWWASPLLTEWTK